MAMGKAYVRTFDRMTNFQKPTTSVDGVLHIKIDHLPAAVPVTASARTSSGLIECILELAQHVFEKGDSIVVAEGKITSDGQVVHPEVKRQEQLRSVYDGTTAEV